MLVADDAQAFADAIVRLARERALWERLQAGGLDNTRRHFSPDTARAVLLPWLQELRTPRVGA